MYKPGTYTQPKEKLSSAWLTYLNYRDNYISISELKKVRLPAAISPRELATSPDI